MGTGAPRRKPPDGPTHAMDGYAVGQPHPAHKAQVRKPQPRGPQNPHARNAPQPSPCPSLCPAACRSTVVKHRQQPSRPQQVILPHGYWRSATQAPRWSSRAPSVPVREVRVWHEECESCLKSRAIDRSNAKLALQQRDRQPVVAPDLVPVALPASIKFKNAQHVVRSVSRL